MTQGPLPVSHKLTLNERKTMTLAGEAEVISFDDSAVVLRTELGTLVIQGQALHLKTLSPENGQVCVEGNICALIYEETRQTRGFWQKLLR